MVELRRLNPAVELSCGSRDCELTEHFIVTGPGSPASVRRSAEVPNFKQVLVPGMVPGLRLEVQNLRRVCAVRPNVRIVGPCASAPSAPRDEVAQLARRESDRPGEPARLQLKSKPAPATEGAARGPSRAGIGRTTRAP